MMDRAVAPERHIPTSPRRGAPLKAVPHNPVQARHWQQQQGSPGGTRVNNPC
jgi:hypothetical protein